MEKPENRQLVSAAWSGDLVAAQDLLARGADINAHAIISTSGQGVDYTPLMWAVRRGWDDIVRFLIEKGADVNLADEKGITPLMTAATSGNGERFISIVRLLVEAGADPDTQDLMQQRTAMSWMQTSFTKGNSSIENILLNAHEIRARKVAEDARKSAEEQARFVRAATVLQRDMPANPRLRVKTPSIS